MNSCNYCFEHRCFDGRCFACTPFKPIQLSMYLWNVGDNDNQESTDEDLKNVSELGQDYANNENDCRHR